jgi:hypothetical protein
MSTHTAVAVTESVADPAGPAPAPPRRTAGLLLLTAGFPLSALCFTEAYRAAGQNTTNPDFSPAGHALFWLAVVVALATTGLIWWRSARGRRLAAALGGVLGALLSLPKVLRAP